VGGSACLKRVLQPPPGPLTGRQPLSDACVASFLCNESKEQALNLLGRNQNGTGELLLRACSLSIGTQPLIIFASEVPIGWRSNVGYQVSELPNRELGNRPPNHASAHALFFLIGLANGTFSDTLFIKFHAAAAAVRNAQHAASSDSVARQFVLAGARRSHGRTSHG